MRALRVVRNRDVKYRKPTDGKDGLDAPTMDAILHNIPKPKDGARGQAGSSGKDAPSMAAILDNIKPLINHGRNGNDAPTLHEILSKVTPLIPKAVHGNDGRHGLDGEIPEHEIDKKNLRIRFREPSGRWGKWLEFKKFLENLPRQIIQQNISRGGGGIKEELGIWKKCIEDNVFVPPNHQLVRAGKICILGSGRLTIGTNAEARAL